MTNAVWVKAWIGRVFFDFAISYVCVPGCLGVELWQKLFRHLCCVREWGSHCISIFIFLSNAVFFLLWWCVQCVETMSSHETTICHFLRDLLTYFDSKSNAGHTKHVCSNHSTEWSIFFLLSVTAVAAFSHRMWIALVHGVMVTTYNDEATIRSVSVVHTTGRKCTFSALHKYLLIFCCCYSCEVPLSC